MADSLRRPRHPLAIPRGGQLGDSLAHECGEAAAYGFVYAIAAALTGGVAERIFPDYNEKQNALVLTLEMVPGGDLQQFLQRHGALAESAVDAVLLQLCSALAHVHGCSVLHRDVKLENLLVAHPGPTPQVKLCDFGHATRLHDRNDGFTGTIGCARATAARPPWSARSSVTSRLGIGMGPGLG